jgi:hypothetical protein
MRSLALLALLALVGLVWTATAGASAHVERLAERYTTVDAPLIFPKRPGRVPGERVDGRPGLRMRPATVALMIDAAAARLGIPPDVLLRVRPGLLRTVQGESGFRPGLVQTHADVNSAYPNRARGLFQVTPFLFRGARVPGRDNIFNPYDNTLAAMLIFWTTPSERGHLLTMDGDQIDSCGRRMTMRNRPRCPLPGVWPQSAGWSAVRFSPDLNPYLDAAQRRFAERHNPW